MGSGEVQRDEGPKGEGWEGPGILVSWYTCDARPRISGMILLELPVLGPVDLSSL